jgi:hypothetical protein
MCERVDLGFERGELPAEHLVFAAKSGGANESPDRQDHHGDKQADEDQRKEEFHGE